MGNALRRSAGEEDHASAGGGDGSDQFAIVLQGGKWDGEPPPRIAGSPSSNFQGRYRYPAAARWRTREEILGPRGVKAAAARAAALDQYILNFISTSMRSSDSDELGKTMVIPQCQCNIEVIDESSAKGLRDALSYVQANEMLIEVQVLGTEKTFWRLSDDATRISRKLALILRSYHSVHKYLTAPLQVSNVWISSTGSGSVKLREVCFTDENFSIARVRDDYKHLCEVLLSLIYISGGDLTKLPPDYKEFLMLLRDDFEENDEFLIVNNSALLPMLNRTEVFLMLYDRINTYLGRTAARREKRRRILSMLPYDDNWLDTALANTQIYQWVMIKEYKKTQPHQLRLNRNVRSHLHDYNDENIEEILYCEWPELLMDMVKMLHKEGELQGTDIENKFG